RPRCHRPESVQAIGQERSKRSDRLPQIPLRRKAAAGSQSSSVGAQKWGGGETHPPHFYRMVTRLSDGYFLPRGRSRRLGLAARSLLAGRLVRRLLVGSALAETDLRGGVTDLRHDELVTALLVSGLDLIARLQTSELGRRVAVRNKGQLLALGIPDRHAVGTFVDRHHAAGDVMRNGHYARFLSRRCARSRRGRTRPIRGDGRAAQQQRCEASGRKCSSTIHRNLLSPGKTRTFYGPQPRRHGATAIPASNRRYRNCNERPLAIGKHRK